MYGLAVYIFVAYTLAIDKAFIIVLCFAGIFRERIKYLLVLTTPLDVVLLGVSFSGDGKFTSFLHFAVDGMLSILITQYRVSSLI